MIYVDDYPSWWNQGFKYTQGPQVEAVICWRWSYNTGEKFEMHVNSYFEHMRIASRNDDRILLVQTEIKT